MTRVTRVLTIANQRERSSRRIAIQASYTGGGRMIGGAAR
jgi:hypothetical protein